MGYDVRMTPAERRYQEGLAVAASLRAGAVSAVTRPVEQEKPDTTDAWLRLVECSETNRPPADAAERRLLEGCGVFDLAPEGKDGCRLRLRVPGGRLRAWQLRELAALTQERGGGFVEIGARGEVELPLVPWRDAALALTQARAAGLSGRGVGGDGIANVVAGPLAGLDGEELVNTGGLVAGLDALGTECMELAAGLPRALRIGVDGGGRGWPARVAQDVVFRAVAGGEFRLWLGGVGTALTDAGLRVPAALALRAGAALAVTFGRSGGVWDVESLGNSLSEALGVRLGRGEPPAEAAGERALTPGVYLNQGGGRSFLVTSGPADGRWRSRALLALAEAGSEVRLVLAFSPAGVLVPGIAEGQVEALAEAGFASAAPA